MMDKENAPIDKVVYANSGGDHSKMNPPSNIDELIDHIIDKIGSIQQFMNNKMKTLIKDFDWQKNKSLALQEKFTCLNKKVQRQHIHMKELEDKVRQVDEKRIDEKLIDNLQHEI